MEKKKDLLTANEARKLSQESDCQLNRLSKAIEEAAKENSRFIYWSVYEMNSDALARLLNTLATNGYEVICFNEDGAETSDIRQMYQIKVQW